ncbi:MAG: BF3164 family lipoprotein [Rikenellaceae bacterium]
MKPITHTITALAALCVVSCAQPEYTSLDDMFTEEQSITVTDEVVLLSPISSALHGTICGSHLVSTIGYNGKYVISIVDIHSGEIEQTLLPKGRGRNESTNAYLIGVQGDNIVCNNRDKSKILKLSFDEAFKATPDQRWRETDMEWDGYWGSKFYPGALEDDRYIFCACSEEGLFEIVDSESNLLYTFGEYNMLDGDEDERAAPYKGRFYTTQSQERLLYSTEYGNVLYFYDISDPNREPKLLNKYHFELPKIDIEHYRGGTSISTNAESIIGTRTAAVSDDYFYLLNDSRTITEVNESKEFGCNTILVFDRDGNPIKRLLLDQRCMYIYYSDSNNSLYTIGINDREEDCLIRYQL